MKLQKQDQRLLDAVALLPAEPLVQECDARMPPMKTECRAPKKIAVGNLLVAKRFRSYFATIKKMTS